MYYLQIEDLPDELIFKVFSYFKINNLLVPCSLLSKRFRAISHDEYLWEKINMSGNFYENEVPIKFLEFILYRGCKFLNLCKAKLEGNFSLDGMSKLRYLDLSNCNAKVGVLEGLLASCAALQKLSLKGCNVTSGMVHSICRNGQNLQVLNLDSCTQREVYVPMGIHQQLESRIWEQYPILSLESIQRICNKCVALKEINLRKTELSEDSVNFLVNNLTTRVDKLNLEQLKFLKDEHIKTLVKRCTRITSIDLRRTGATNESLKNIIGNLKTSLEELSVSCDKITCNKLTRLTSIYSMPRLKVLNCYDFFVLTDVNLALLSLKKRLPHVTINEKRIAIAENGSYKNGIWDVKAQQLELDHY